MCNHPKLLAALRKIENPMSFLMSIALAHPEVVLETYRWYYDIGKMLIELVKSNASTLQIVRKIRQYYPELTLKESKYLA